MNIIQRRAKLSKKETFYKEEKHQEGTKTLLQEIRDWNLDESLSFVRVLSTVRVNIKKLNKIIKHIEKEKKRVFEINVCCLICTYNKLQKKA